MLVGHVQWIYVTYRVTEVKHITLSLNSVSQRNNMIVLVTLFIRVLQNDLQVNLVSVENLCHHGNNHNCLVKVREWSWSGSKPLKNYKWTAVPHVRVFCWTTHPQTSYSPLLFSQWTGVIITMASRSLYHFGINTCCSEAERTDAASLQLSLITSGFVVVRCNTDIIRIWTIRRGQLSHRESVSLNLRAKTRDTQMIWGQRDLTERWDIQKEKQEMTHILQYVTLHSGLIKNVYSSSLANNAALALGGSIMSIH